MDNLKDFEAKETPPKKTKASASGSTGGVTCPYHRKPLQKQTETRTVPVLDKEGRETDETQEITVEFAVCDCVEPGTPNPYRGRRVWERT